MKDVYKCRVKWGYIAHLILIPTFWGPCSQGDARRIVNIKQLHVAMSGVSTLTI